jgi:hypothetical protein
MECVLQPGTCLKCGGPASENGLCADCHWTARHAVLARLGGMVVVALVELGAFVALLILLRRLL